MYKPTPEYIAQCISFHPMKMAQIVEKWHVTVDDARRALKLAGDPRNSDGGEPIENQSMAGRLSLEWLKKAWR